MCNGKIIIKHKNSEWTANYLSDSQYAHNEKHKKITIKLDLFNGRFANGMRHEKY